jgi:hypothetical protein|tara:strand:- start:200 stop:3031 length:2832 start_codon:yes stop_codon:yes gene_type:complete
METKDFLQRALGDSGLYCVFASHGSEDRRVQKFYTSTDAVMTTAHELDKSGFNAYFALATFEVAGSRKVTNVKQLRAFFLDLDCGPSKDYPNQDAALAALRTFCEKLKLPKPLLVNSGRGVHVYWFLSEPVSLTEWLPTAERLKQLCAEHNLLADPSVTADAARVLRVPGTHNHKGQPPLAVGYFGTDDPASIDLDVFKEYLGGDWIPVPTKHIPAGSNAVMDALLGNRKNVFKDIVLKTHAGNGCAQIKNILANQDEISEPLWRAGLSIAKFCEDSTKAAHEISKNHPEYDAQDTLKKMDLIKGPYLCGTFNEFNPGVCDECPNKHNVKSPISLGSRIREATEEDNVVEAPAITLPNSPIKTYVIPGYPNPYFRGANGGVYTRETLPDGSVGEKAVYHNDLYVVRRLWDSELGEAVVMRLHLPKDGVREFTIPLASVNSRDEFRKQMSMYGVAVSKKGGMDEIMQYTTTWVNELQASSAADEAHKQFGWTDDDCSSFVLGNQEIFKDRIEFNPPSNQTVGLFPAFEPKGTLEKWKETMNFYNHDGFEIHQFVVGSSFGSVLMNLSPVNCAALHLHGTTGVGKTTAMFAGASVWGFPKDLVLDRDDTHNIKMHRGEIYHNLPLYIDELTNAKAAELSNLAYQLTGGKQRGRMASGGNAERYRGEAWKLLAVTTANTGIIEMINMAKAMPKAEAQRILEVKVERIFDEVKDKRIQDAFLADVMNNYGHAGTIFIQHVMNNMDGVKKLIDEVRIKVDTAAGLTSENRFWSAFATNTIAGLVLAKRAGLIEYDMGKLFKWAVSMLRQNKNCVSDMNTSVEETLNDYIHEHWSNVLWIKSTDDLRKQNDNGLDSLVVPEALPRGKLVARYETDLKVAYLIPKPLRIWCGEQQINYTAFLADLKTNMGATKMKMRLSKGTHMQLPPTDVIVVSCSIGGSDEAGSVKGR